MKYQATTLKSPRKQKRNNWVEANQKYILAAVEVVRERLKNHAAGIESQTGLSTKTARKHSDAEELLERAGRAMTSPSALDLLSTAFGLTSFERSVLILCAGMELDSTFAAYCAAAQGDTSRVYPTYSLALAALPEAHWSALIPGSPLRRWKMIEIAGNSLTASPLYIDENVLHFLVGLPYRDERICSLMSPASSQAELPASHDILAKKISRIWSDPVIAPGSSIVQLSGPDNQDKINICQAACELSGLTLFVMRPSDIPASAQDREVFIRLWERQAILNRNALLIICENADTEETRRSISFLELAGVPVIAAVHETFKIERRNSICIAVPKPEKTEQLAIWQRNLGSLGNGDFEEVVSQFSLSTRNIEAASRGLILNHSLDNPGDFDRTAFLGMLRDQCREQCRTTLEELARRIIPAATWEDLILPEQPKNTLREIAIQVKHRTRVYETWGFAAKSPRGLGISALFTGESGTGKTMAAEVLANELCLDLFHIDLSQVVSKYIGETEKNLRRIFDAAEEGGAILLFDEADALFGRRSEVKDSHDRYANIEISYLLQRMEAYRGLAILTTNMKGAMDQAFLRRIRFIVSFPFPDASLRAEIWKRIFPQAAPTMGLDAVKLAQLNMAGGNIRNIALCAAFMAAHKGQPVQMKHVLSAARNESAKLEKPLSAQEISGWI